MTLIKANNNLFNGGKCFTANRIYETKADIRQQSDLMDAWVINDLDEKHKIGLWYKEFTIVKPKSKIVNGRKYKVFEFNSEDTVNLFILNNTGWGVIHEEKGKIFVAKNDDFGILQIK